MKLFQYLLLHLSFLSVNMLSSLSTGSCFFLLGQLAPDYFGNSRNKLPLFPSGSSKSPSSEFIRRTYNQIHERHLPFLGICGIHEWVGLGYELLTESSVGQYWRNHTAEEGWGQGSPLSLQLSIVGFLHFCPVVTPDKWQAVVNSSTIASLDHRSFDKQYLISAL